MLPKVFRASIGLGKIATISRGLEIGKGKLRKLRRCWNDVPVLSGEEVQKYAPENVVFIDTSIAKKFSKEDAIFAAPKIMIRETGGVLLGCFDEQGILTLRTLHNVHIKQSEMDEKYILALINAKLLQYVFELCFKQAGNIFPKIRIAQERQLPIRRISFITAKDQREKLADEEKKLYENYLENGNCDSLLSFVDQRLEKQYIPDPELAKKHNADPLNKDFQIREGELVEQSDVVHDLLAFLAEKMIEYNKEKNKETKSFLGWLEREVGTEVESLTGKTIIKKYHETTGDNLISILKKNKKKLQVDPSRRDFQDKLSTEFDRSIQKLTPLKHKIEMTDHLIGQIVYKLYGLTEEEIKIVEGS